MSESLQNNEPDLYAIAIDNGATLVEVNEEYLKSIEYPTPEDFIETSRLNKTVIELGFFKDRQRQIFTFFHELGHLKDDYYTKYKTAPADDVRFHIWLFSAELRAWIIGLEIAKKYNVKLSPETIAWGYTQLQSYADYR